MKLCIPVGAPNGLDSALEPHLPRAEHLLFFDTVTRDFTEISLRDETAGAGEQLEMHAVLCGSINRVTLRTLIEQGVKVYGTDAATVSQAIAQYENGELEAAVVGAGAGGCGGGGCCSGDHQHEDHASVGGGHGCHGSGGGCGGHGGGNGGGAGGGGCGGHGHHHDHDAGGCCGSKGAQQADAVERSVAEVLKVAVCSQNRKTVTEHAGKCRKFWIYDVKQGQVTDKTLLELPLEQSFHATPSDQAHPLDAVDVLISAGIGSGLQQRLLQRGINALVTAETDPDQAVALFLSGEMTSLPTEPGRGAATSMGNGKHLAGTSAGVQ